MGQTQADKRSERKGNLQFLLDNPSVLGYNKIMRSDLKQVTLYTDGACSGNPGAGGWGCVLLYGKHKLELSGGEENTTNNRMELMAVIAGLERLKYPCAVDVYSDSAYTVRAFDERWVYAWEQSGWKKADNKPVLNVDLWQRLLELTRVHRVTFHKVKGHADNELNNRCDELARGAVPSAAACKEDDSSL